MNRIEKKNGKKKRVEREKNRKRKRVEIEKSIETEKGIK